MISGTDSETNRSAQMLKHEDVLAAIERSLAMIAFNTNGEVIWANALFAETIGYRTSELVGMSHRTFCLKQYADSKEYARLWEGLCSGRAFQDKITRVAKDGRTIRLEASYMPVVDDVGKVYAVLKVATDINAREQASIHMTEQLLGMSDRMLHRAREGMSKSLEVEEAADKVAEASERNKAILQHLEQHTESILSIVEVIRHVSSQTQLLALNAAIEAAHAGERGRGFDIIAKEVRKLAGQVQQSALEVNGYVEGMVGQVHAIIEGTNRTQSAVSASQSLIRLAVEQFHGIEEAAKQLDEQAKQIGAVVE
ncbi:methyl-accepting chemotaxis protein [Paenibacillus sp. J5C_2022]|uniref:methyl-accepting chemotaxis protein n=1 Tax=Paenibacillus sp. J5C2022 TaxID=2977129 RepID=UPI0021D21C43|nr:methyl-accepting chemotaxis protein [Paenibacillus sp. J5C2022]MCU6710554.1 methyl-accepting chemotaxis protein [Paenibacillus sp. J5C2022]